MAMDIAQLHALFLGSTGVCTDTRKIEEGNIFFALKGDNFNGNTFALQALEKGCVYAVVDEDISGEGIVQVPNALEALQELSVYHRSKLDIPVIGITGSNGKTTTKELMRDVLNKKYNTFATGGNFNNHIGVPLSLLSITSDHKMAIIEMGANKPGDIAELCSFSNPDYGIITNIGRAHLEGFGSFEGVIKTKSELYDHLRKKNGPTFVNTTLPELQKPSEGLNKVAYSGDDDWFKTDVIKGELQLTFNFSSGTEQRKVRTQLVGDYNIFNVQAAIAVGLYFNVAFNDIADALEEYTPENKRSQLMETGKNRIILDAYNANPTSMEAALKNIEGNADGFFILGEMLELGDVSASAHEEILRSARRKGINGITIGGLFKAASLKEGYTHFDDKSEFLDYIKSHPIEGKLILIKGSRGGQLEDLTDVL